MCVCGGGGLLSGHLVHDSLVHFGIFSLQEEPTVPEPQSRGHSGFSLAEGGRGSELKRAGVQVRLSFESCTETGAPVCVSAQVFSNQRLVLRTPAVPPRTQGGAVEATLADTFNNPPKLCLHVSNKFPAAACSDC